MKKFLTFTYLLCSVLLLTACSTQPILTTQARAGAELSAYKTYAFKPSAGTDASGNASITSAHIKSAVAREMSARGYQFSEVDPDLWVDFTLSVVNQPKKNTGPVINLGMFGSHGGVSVGIPVAGSKSNINEVNRISIDLLDNKRREVVWEGSYEAGFTERDSADPSIAVNAAINILFSKFPVK